MRWAATRLAIIVIQSVVAFTRLQPGHSVYKPCLHIQTVVLHQVGSPIFGILQMQLDFAAMQKEDPSLLTLKDFVMSSNQAPNSPDDILSLLQAFAEFKQGADALFLSCGSSALYCTRTIVLQLDTNSSMYHRKRCVPNLGDNNVVSSAMSALSLTSCLANFTTPSAHHLHKSMLLPLHASPTKQPTPHVVYLANINT